MIAWTTINPNQLIPPALTAAVSGAASALSAALSVSLPSLPSSLSLPSPPNPATAVINAILDTLQSLLRGGPIHALTIPIAKTIPGQGVAKLPPTLSDLQGALGQSAGAPSATDASSYASMISGVGGNAGFYRAFAAAMMDARDPNRPQYDAQTDAVVMAVLLVGAPSYPSIVAAASTLDALVAPQGDNSAAARTVPTPQNLKVTVASTSQSPGIGVQLEWGTPSTSFASPFFPGVVNKVSRYAVIRSTSPSAQSARSVLDLFTTQALTVGMASADGTSTVVAIGTGATSSYLDASASDPSKPTFYCVAWEVQATENGATTTTLPFDRVSNVTKVSVRAPQPPQTGTSPSWVGAASALAAFPAVEQAASALVAQVASLLAPPNGATATSRLAAAADLASASAARLGAQASALVGDLARTAAAFSRPIPSMYVAQLASNSGGNAYLLQQLATLLGNTSDPSTPPFFNDEYVCGVCFVAGAPRMADLAPQQAFFSAMFGPASPANPLVGLLAAIDTAVTAAETTVFGTNMQPLPAGTPAPVPPPATPVIAADGTPVGTDDPQNPNAGFTNVTTAADLC
jgi:hypothetical protein